MSKLKFRSFCGLAAVLVSALAMITAATLPVGASTSSGVAKAKVAIAAAEKIPTKLAVSTPLKKSATSLPKETVVFLECNDVAACTNQGTGLQAAAKAIGWNYKVVDWDETQPSTFVAAMTTALQYHPIGVYFSGEPYAVWQSEIPAYQAAHAVIVPSAEAAQPLNKVVIASIAGLTYSNTEGQWLSDYVTATSGGKADTLFVTVPSFPPFPPLQADFLAAQKQSCPACKTTVLGVTIPQLDAGGLVPAVVSALKTNPGITYIASVDGSFITGIESALSGAGLAGKYKIISASAGAGNLQNVQNGSEAMTISDGGEIYGGWLDIDTTLRWLEHMPITVTNLSSGGWLPALMTKSNVITSADGDSNFPTDYAKLFLKLWKVS
jgi:ribose transport system substrate-binding protein